MIFNRRLSFFKHADQLKEKAELLSAKVIAFVQVQGGLQPKDSTRLYQQVMLPALTYASVIWRSEKPDCRLSTHIVSVQCTVLAFLGAFRTTCTAALQVLMRAPPLRLELDRANAYSDCLSLLCAPSRPSTTDPRVAAIKPVLQEIARTTEV